MNTLNRLHDNTTQEVDPMNANNAKPLAGYVRVSRKGERDSLDVTHDQQREAIEKHAARIGRAVVMFEPEDNVSGSKSSRAVLDSILEGVRTGKLGGVVVYRLNRLSRLPARARLDLFETIEDECGGIVESASESLDTTTPEGRFARDMFLGLARMEWERYAEGFEDAKRRAVDRGVHITGTLPVGYSRGDDGILVPNENAPAISRAFTIRAGGGSLADVVSHLNAAIPGGPTGTKAKWHRGTTANVLRNRVYLGEARQGAHVNAEAHVALTDADTFEMAAAVASKYLAANGGTHSPRGRSLLAGLVRCSCGAAMTRSRSNGHGVYRCHAKESAGIECATPSTIQEANLDAYVREAIVGRIAEGASFTMFALTGSVATSEEQAAARAKLGKAREARLALESPDLIAKLGAESFGRMIDKADAAVAKAEAKLAEVAPLAAPSETSLSLADATAEIVDEQERADLARLIGRVVVSRGAHRRSPVAERVAIEWREQISANVFEPNVAPEIADAKAERALVAVAA